MSYHVLNRPALNFMLRGPQGAVTKDMVRRGKNVERRAKRNLSGGGSVPKRIDTGRLRASIATQARVSTRGAMVRVGTNVEYAIFVHDGTGIYGPRRARIYPRTAGVLVFSARRIGGRPVRNVRRSGPFRGKIVVRSIAGMERNPFLQDAIIAARD